MEKLGIMTKLVNERNIDQAGACRVAAVLCATRSADVRVTAAVQAPWRTRARVSTALPVHTLLQVLLEFKEYATEVDVDFVRKAVRAIGYCAVSIQSAAER